MEGLDNWLLKTNKEPILSKKTIDERNLLYDISDLFLRNIRSYYFAMKKNIEYKNIYWTKNLNLLIYIWTMHNKLKCDSLKNI